jgi:cell volume regulation protein A
LDLTSGALLLTAAGSLLLVATLLSPLSQRLGVPMMLVFLVVGMLAGEEGPGGIPFEDYELSFDLGTLALVLILFDGGLNTKLATVRSAAWPALTLATLGVVVTAGLTAAGGILLGLPTPVAVLVGCVASSTDAAAVFSVLRGGGVRLRRRLAAILEVESGINDPMAMLLTIVGAEALASQAGLGAHTVAFFAEQLLFGALTGLGVGFVGRFVLRHAPLPAAGLYPAVTVALAFLAFGLASLIDGSGLLSVYVAAVLVGDSHLPYRPWVLRVHDTLAWFAQLAMFLMLGLLVFPSALVPIADEGLIMAVVLALVARPAAVMLSLWPFRLEAKERAFVAWVGLRGAVPIILATYPVVRGVPLAGEIFNVVFFVVLANGLVQGGSVAWLARRWRLVESATVPPPASIDLLARDDYAGAFRWLYVHAPAAVAGAHLRDLPLPHGCLITLIVRGDQVIPPHGGTRLEPGDHVCLFSTDAHRALLGLLFANPDPGDD